MNYREALDFVYSFTNFEVTPAGTYSSKTFDLTRTERLLAALGNPQRRFRSVHVAGTKGKGSTAAMTESILRAAGHLTGLYTSPHLHTFRERIRVAGQMISEEEVAAGISKIRPIAEQIPRLTTFEVMTALAFDFFAQRGVEIAVLEVGLGGRLDATNVVTPLVSAITSISYDHTAILGDTLTKIAEEKAGIIKPDIPVVSCPQEDEAHEVIDRVAKDRHAQLIAVAPDLSFRLSGIKYQVIPDNQSLDGQTFLWMTVRDAKLSLVTVQLPLLGQHQLINAATTIAIAMVLRELGIDIPDAAIVKAFERVQWQGRFEILAREPYVVVDGAHNPESAQRLVETLREYLPSADIHLIFGASNDKDIDGMFRQLLPHVSSLVLTRSHNPRAANPTLLAGLAQRYNVETSIAPDLRAALEEARTRATEKDVVCVTGSLFVVAEARQAFFAEHGETTEQDPR
jgi:dihydrofolate synthase/folylpolyglutamate synthase